MTNPIQPATDEEVEAMREAWSAEPVSWVNTGMMRLIARIDAERARAERLLNDLSEAALREANDFIQRLEMNKDAKALHTHALRVAADNAALRGEVADAREWMKGSEKWGEVQATIRAHVAKAEAERDAERAARESAEAVLAEHTQPALASNLGGYHAVRDGIAAAVGHEPTWGWSLVRAVENLAARAETAEGDAQHAREESASAFDAAATHLARAERAEAALQEALRPLPSRWGPADVLSSLLAKASRADQAETRAEHAEARAERAEGVLRDPSVFISFDGCCVVCDADMRESAEHFDGCVVAALSQEKEGG